MRSSLKDFELLDRLGKGSFGVVYKARRRASNHIYVIKQIDLVGISSSEQQEALNEVRILASLDCEYITKYYDSFVDEGKLNIVMEYADSGTLHSFLQKHKKRGRVSRVQVWRFFLQLLLGLKHIHKSHILHRDLKALNIFLDKSSNVKIGDFGVSKLMSSTAHFAKTLVGTPYYLSPELCENKPYNEKSDIWALGCILYEMCTLRHPFDAQNQGALILKIVRGKFPPIDVAYYGADLSRLVRNCLCRDYRARPSVDELLADTEVHRQLVQCGLVAQDGQARESRPPMPSEAPVAALSSRPEPKADEERVVAGPSRPSAIARKPSAGAVASTKQRQRDPIPGSGRSRSAPKPAEAPTRGGASDSNKPRVRARPSSARLQQGGSASRLQRKPPPLVPRTGFSRVPARTNSAVRRSSSSQIDGSARAEPEQKPVNRRDAEIAMVAALPDIVIADTKPDVIDVTGHSEGLAVQGDGGTAGSAVVHSSPLELGGDHENQGDVLIGEQEGASSTLCSVSSSSTDEFAVSRVHVNALAAHHDDDDVHWKIVESDVADADADDDAAADNEVPRLDREERDVQFKVNRFLDKIDKLGSEVDQLKKECTEMIPDRIFNELYLYFKNVVGDCDDDAVFDEAQEDAIHRFVFGRISFENAEVVSKLYHLIEAEKEVARLTKTVGVLLVPAPSSSAGLASESAT